MSRFEAAADTYWISLKYLSISRLVIAGVLVALVPLSGSAIGGSTGGSTGQGIDRLSFQVITLAYLAAACIFLAVIDALRPRFQAQLTIQILVDLVMLTALIHTAGGVRSGFGILLIAPVAGAAILSAPLVAGFFAALAAMLLLGETVWRALHSASVDGDFVQAGLTGAACFAATLLVNRLAGRLGAQEDLARRRGEDLRSQLAINQLVIADLPDGVIVMSRDGELRTMNRSARELVGDMSSDDALESSRGRASAVWRTLSAAHAVWRAAGAPQGHATETVLHPDAAVSAGSAPAHRIRLRFLGTPHADGDSVVVIEDLERIEQRAQQLKLASMGRLSASIAHEIRNPLGAIRHANGLLAERLDDPQLRRLATIVEDNSVRINRVVEHVLSIARRERAAADAIDMTLFLETFVPEFAEHNGQPADRLAVAIETNTPLMFDVEHLRQVLVNLSGNALRYASGTPAAVRISWRAVTADRLELTVSDDGPGLTPEQAQHAFEPFYTTEARGTGLGLYLVRELCASNGASIRYERHPAGSRYAGGFVITPVAAER